MLLRLLVVSLIAFPIACSPSKKLSRSSKIDRSETDTAAGLNAIKMNDCVTCHKFSEELIGPSFLSVAEKYEFNSGNVDKLSDKIRKGGSGSWGNLPMTPHLSMSKGNAKIIVKYILSLKK